jgi:TRAP-type C4-dicarboxylate transport system substrate-binding protein
MVRKPSALLALILVSAVASGCAGAPPGDKAGGPGGGPVALRMASPYGGLDSIPAVEDFIRRVNALSGGTVQIQVINQWGDLAPDAEAQVVRAAAAGTVDLGWAGSRVFDTIGVPGFRALSAPMLIDSYPLENAVLHSAMPGRMLAGLASAHVTGLGVLGEGLRLPISARRPLLAPADWRGVSFGTLRSQVQEETIRALGATPVVGFGPDRSHALGSGQIRGFELDLSRYVDLAGLATGAPYVAANVALWPEFDVLIASPRRLASLTAQQRTWLRQAAGGATRDSVALAASGNATSIGRACAMGARFVTATPADLAALRKALSVVYQHLQADPQTRAFLQQIQRLKNTAPAGPAPRIPAGCTRQP